MAKKEMIVTEEMKNILKATTSEDVLIANTARNQLGNSLKAALEVPLKKGVMPGNTLGGIFIEEAFEPGVAPEYPIDFVAPGSEKNFIAFTVPHTGRIPEMNVEGSYLMVATYDIATSIDWARKYARDARWPVLGRAMKVAGSAMQRKKNNDGWHVIITAASNRGLSVYDSQATAGFFSKRLIALAKTVMRRNSGGNSTSVDQGKLTHVAISPEGLEDIRSWDLTMVDDFTRREIFVAGEGEMSLTKIFGVVLIDLDELGEGQEYQKYYNNTLGASTPTGKNEIAIGLDLASNDSFFSPYRITAGGQRVEMVPRITLIEQNREGYSWREEIGFAQLDSRRSLILGF